MNEAIAKNNKTASWFFDKANKIYNRQLDSSRKTEKRFKSIKLEMRKDNLKQTMQKYKGSQRLL